MRRRRTVLCVALLAGLAGIGLTPVFLGHLQGVDYTTPGSESDHAQRAITQRTGFTEQDIVVFSSARHRVGDAAFRDAVIRGGRAIHRVEPGAAFVAPGRRGGGAVARDGRALTATLALHGDAHHRQETIRDMQGALRDAMPPGISAGVTGNSALLGDLTRVEENEITGAEAVGLPVAAVILLIAFGSAVAAGLPLLLGVSGLFVSFAVIAALMALRSFNGFVESAMVMLGLAIGIDYALLLVRRFREERARGDADAEAMVRTLTTAGRTVLFSGAIFATSLVPLTVANLPFFGDTALALIVVVAAEVVLLLTFLPAVLLTLGDRLERGRLPVRRVGAGRWRRWALAVMRRPLPVLAAGGALLLLAASPALGLSTGIDLNARAMPDQPSVKPLEALQRHFPAAALAPLEIYAPRGAAARAARVARARADLREVTATPIGRDAVLISATPTVGTDTPASAELVRSLRAQLRRAVGDAATVGGVTASTVDYNHRLDRTTPWVIGAVLALGFVLLMWLFRSPLLAAKAIVMNLLSVGAAIGLTVLVFQHGHGEHVLGFTSPGYLQAWTPLLLFAMVFGLSMDYEVFMVSRIREEWERSGDTTAAVADGLEHTGAIVTFAATIMFAIFASFELVVIPEMKQLGFALAVAVLIDATIVRAMLVPAFMRLAGEWNWWMPAALDRRLPKLEH